MLQKIISLDLVAMALPSKYISSILFTRIASIDFIYAGAFLYALYIQSIGSGIGSYSGLDTLLLSSFLVTTRVKDRRFLTDFKMFHGSINNHAKGELSFQGLTGFNCYVNGNGRGSFIFISKFHSNPVLLVDRKVTEGDGVVTKVTNNEGKVVTAVDSVNNKLVDSLKTVTEIQTLPQATQTEANLSTDNNTSEFGYLRRIRNLVCNCSFNRVKYYFINFILFTLVVIIYYCLFSTISFVDLIQILGIAIIFYKMFYYNNFTKSSLYNILLNKMIIGSILSVIGYLILYLFDINILNYIHCDSEDDDENDGNNTDNEGTNNSKKDKGKGKAVSADYDENEGKITINEGESSSKKGKEVYVDDVENDGYIADNEGESNTNKDNGNGKVVLNVIEDKDNDSIVVTLNKENLLNSIKAMARDVPPHFASGIGVAATIKALSSLNLPPMQKILVIIAGAGGAAFTIQVGQNLAEAVSANRSVFDRVRDDIISRRNDISLSSSDLNQVSDSMASTSLNRLPAPDHTRAPSPVESISSTTTHGSPSPYESPSPVETIASSSDNESHVETIASSSDNESSSSAETFSPEQSFIDSPF